MTEPKGVIYGPKADAKIQKTVREVARRMMNEQPTRARWAQSTGQPQAVILDAALAAVTNPKIPSSALATVCSWSAADEENTETDLQITVYNHSFTAYAVNTMGAAIFINGHYWFFGDCAAMSAGLRAESETPP